MFDRDLLERGKSVDGVLIRRVQSGIVYSISSKSRRDGAPEVEGLRTELIALPIRLSNLFDDKIDDRRKTMNYLFDQL